MSNDINIEKIMEDISQGKTIAKANGISDEDMETVFDEATSMYTAGNFEEAEEVYKALAILSHTDSRCWMGLAACRHARGHYAAAVDAYGMAAYTSGMEDLRPLLYGAKCHISLGDAASAEAALNAVLEMDVPDNDVNRDCRREAENLFSMIKKGSK